MTDRDPTVSGKALGTCDEGAMNAVTCTSGRPHILSACLNPTHWRRLPSPAPAETGPGDERYLRWAREKWNTTRRHWTTPTFGSPEEISRRLEATIEDGNKLIAALESRAAPAETADVGRWRRADMKVALTLRLEALTRSGLVERLRDIAADIATSTDGGAGGGHFDSCSWRVETRDADAPASGERT